MMRKRLWRVKGVGYFPLIFLLFQQLWGPKNSPVKPQAYKWLMHVAALFSVWNSCAERFHGFWSYIGRYLDSLNYSFEIQGTHWILFEKKNFSLKSLNTTYFAWILLSAVSVLLCQQPFWFCLLFYFVWLKEFLPAGFKFQSDQLSKSSNYAKYQDRRSNHKYALCILCQSKPPRYMTAHNFLTVQQKANRRFGWKQMSSHCVLQKESLGSV